MRLRNIPTAGLPAYPVIRMVARLAITRDISLLRGVFTRALRKLEREWCDGVAARRQRESIELLCGLRAPIAVRCLGVDPTPIAGIDR